MAEKRKKTSSVCVKNGAMGSGTIEFFPASQWGGAPDVYRLRVNRQWLDGTYGEKRFFSPADVACILAYHIFGVDLREIPRKKAPENMRRHTRISVPVGSCGLREVTRISTERPFLCEDGHWYVGAYMLGRGVVMVPCDDVIVKE